ncbi:MAG: hypothetical protein WCD86_00495 [Ktedonobacteraceae bacterium]
MSIAVLDAPLHALSCRRSLDEREARSPSLPAKRTAPDAAPGVFERVDLRTLEVIHQVFPTANSGVAFLSLLLREAEVSRRAGGEECGQEVAVITVQSLRDLATRIGWGYDTTHKYVILFCALGLLTKRRANGKVELHFALGRYMPPLSLDALDRLIAQSRPKVQSYARKVRRRYLLLYGNDERASSPVCHPAESSVPELDEAIQQVRQLMERAASSVTQTDLAAVLTTLHRAQRRMGIGAGDSVPTGDFAHPGEQAQGRLLVPTGDSAHIGEQEKGRLRMHRGDSSPIDEQANGRLLRKTGDSSPSSEPENGRLLRGESPESVGPTTENGRRFPTLGDSAQITLQATGGLAPTTSPVFDAPAVKNGRLGGKKPPISPARNEANGRRVPQPEDSTHPTEQEHGRLLAQKSPESRAPEKKNGRLLPHTGDPHTESPVSIGDSGTSAIHNVNVSLETLIKDGLNGNVKNVAAFLQTLFHEEPTKRGYYYHLHKQCPRPECWLAATIKTLVGMHQTKTVKNPGRYFYDCCVRLHGDATLPPEEQALVAQYAHLSSSQLLQTLAQPHTPAAPSPTRPCGTPDQYEAFVTRRRAELRAEFQTRHPGVSPTSPPAGPDQYAAFVARRTQELKAASAAKGA